MAHHHDHHHHHVRSLVLFRLFIIIFINSQTFGTHWLRIHSVKGCPREWTFTVPTNKAFRVPLCIERSDVIIRDWFRASSTFGCEQGQIVTATIGLPILLVKPFLSKLLATVGTEKVLRMPVRVKSCDAFIQNRSIAVCTTWGVEFVIVIFTVGLSFPLIKVFRPELLTTMGTGEMFRVPSFPKSRDNLSNYRLVTSGTNSLLCGTHSLFIHACLEVAKHRIKLMSLFGLLSEVALLPIFYLEGENWKEAATEQAFW